MKCGNCGKKLDAHTYPTDEKVEPQNGDISICMYCGEVNQFQDGKLVLIDTRDLPEDVCNEIQKIESARQKVICN